MIIVARVYLRVPYLDRLYISQKTSEYVNIMTQSGARYMARRLKILYANSCNGVGKKLKVTHCLNQENWG